MGGNVQRLAAAIRSAQTAVTQEVGEVLTDPAGGLVTVQVGPHQVPAVVPGSFRSQVKAGQSVRLIVQGAQIEVASILSPLEAPPVTPGAAVPAADAGVWSSGYTGAPWSGMTLEQLIGNVIGVVGDINKDRESANWNAGKINAAISLLAADHARIDQIVVALREQGLLS